MIGSETAGAGTGALPRIDLNGERRSERRLVRARSRRAGMMLGALALFGILLLMPLTLHVFALRRQMQNTDAQAQALSKRLQSAATESSQLDGRIASWTGFQQNQQARQAWSRLLPALAACLPSDVSIQQVSIAIHGTDAQIQLQMSAGTMEGLRGFTLALGRSQQFSQLRLLETTADHSLGSHGVSFQMSGPVGGAAVTSADNGTS